ncbi:MAG: peptidoglycan-binding protein [Gammaproteobacteria bacterium]|nr:peptidoglycan-binding protein [Gammaproteobacteria bacterium]
MTDKSHAGTNVAPAPNTEAVANVQSRLVYLGYDPGPVDGIYGPRTAKAIRAYQRDHGLGVDGRVTATLEDHITSMPKPGTVGI